MNRLATNEELKVLDDWMLYYSGDRLKAKNMRDELQRAGFDIVVIREPLAGGNNACSD